MKIHVYAGCQERAFGPRRRRDHWSPINVATKALYDAGVTVVFAAGNSGNPKRVMARSVKESE